MSLLRPIRSRAGAAVSSTDHAPDAPDSGSAPADVAPTRSRRPTSTPPLDPSFDAYRGLHPTAPQSTAGAATPSASGMSPTKRDASPAPTNRGRRSSDRRLPGRRTRNVIDATTPTPAPAPAPAKKSSSPSPAKTPMGWRKRLNRLGKIELTTKKIKREEVMIFARQMSSFVRAGIPVIDALGIIAEDTQDKKLQTILAAVSSDLRGGSSLTKALAVHTEAFPKYFVSMIRSAELTGRLDEVLDQLSIYLDREIETRRKVKSAMTYPSVIFVMAIGTIVLLSVFVLPKFVEFFQSFDAELPWATKALIALAGFMGAWGTFMAIVGLWFVLFIALLTRRERGKLVRDRVYLGFPKVGALLRTASIERFCRILSVLVRAGVPLPDALAVAAETTGNRVYRRAIAVIRTSIMRGNGLAGPIADSGLFPAAARQMIRVGESTGTLEEQLASAAEFYGRELEYRLKKFTDLFEPAIVAFMGLVVGFVAYALVSAMYGVFNQVNT